MSPRTRSGLFGDLLFAGILAVSVGLSTGLVALALEWLSGLR